VAGYKHDEGEASNIVLREFEVVTVVANLAGGGSCSCSSGGVRTSRGLSGVHTRRGCSPARGVAGSPMWDTADGDVQLHMLRQGEGAEKMRTAKVRDGSVIFYRVGDPNRVVLDGPDRMSARSNG